MSKSEDVSLFEQGVDAWNSTIKSRRPSTPSDNQDSRYLADLSGASLGSRAFHRFINRIVRTTLETLVSYPKAEFSLCDLRGTSFNIPTIGYDFRQAIFAFANLQGADLSGADLKGAIFRFANLRDAILSGARLDDVQLFDVDLTGVNLTQTSPWRAKLFDEPELPQHTITDPGCSTIRSVSNLLTFCSDLQAQTAAASYRFYFRGEERSWKLRPSVMRSLRLRDSEGRMLTELMTRRPHEFSQIGLAFDQWVLAQHHGLKTRLLDVTRNPLVALFFACDSMQSMQADGRLHVFAVPPALIKPYNSDSISVVANFAKLSFAEQSTLLGKRREITRDYKRAMRKLYHLIGEEKPHFLQRIDPRDLFRVFVVEPKYSFEMISAQSAAFFISAFHERFEHKIISRFHCRTPVYEHFILTIPASDKCHIIKELRTLNITRDTLFPSLTEAASAITTHQGKTPPIQDHADRRKISDSAWDYPKPPLPPPGEWSPPWES